MHFDIDIQPSCLYVISHVFTPEERAALKTESTIWAKQTMNCSMISSLIFECEKGILNALNHTKPSTA